VDGRNDTVICGTFSKIFALGGLRIGGLFPTGDCRLITASRLFISPCVASAAVAALDGPRFQDSRPITICGYRGYENCASWADVSPTSAIS